MRRGTLEERLFAKVRVNPSDPDACWIWTGSTDTNGYGQLRRRGRKVGAHRAAYEIYNGPLTPGKPLDHRCHTPRCVNPSHLREATHKENAEHRAGATRVSRSGVRGVSWHRRDGKWQVQVRHNGRLHAGGYFDDLNEADKAARALRLQLFTHNDTDR